MRNFQLLSAVALALTASACATPPAEKYSAAGAAGQAVKAGQSKAKSEKARRMKPWWRLSQYSRKPNPDVRRWGEIRPGNGLLGGDEDGFVLYRKGEAGGSSDSGKPTKVKR